MAILPLDLPRRLLQVFTYEHLKHAIHGWLLGLIIRKALLRNRQESHCGLGVQAA
jgi:hypothetical protein